MGGSGLGDGGEVEFWRAEAACWRAEAEQLAGRLAQARGQGVGEDALRARIAELEGQVGALTEKVSVLTKTLFGTSSERKGKAPGPAPDGGEGGGGSAGGGSARSRAAQGVAGARPAGLRASAHA